MNSVVITVDVDWAPDWAMRDLLAVLVDAAVPSTWFVTHDTPVLDELRAHPEIIELGIHPNFLPGSSHGTNPSDVLRTCMELVPEARAMRTHCLVQSTPILQAVVDTTPVLVDTSLYVRDAVGIRPSPLPLDRGRALMRYPYVWEDDLEFFAAAPRWDARTLLADRRRPDEISIIDVHPIHFALNSADIGPYRELKSVCSHVDAASQQDAERFRNSGDGTRTFIESLVGMRDGRFEFTTLSTLHTARTSTTAEVRAS